MNPGTSEMQFVGALDRVEGMRGVLCLQESVCAGAADGYARMSGRPAATLLHLGPGLANALSNFHNARKARSPIVNVVGEHATHHLAYDAPLTADVEAIARPVSSWVQTLHAPEDIGRMASGCIAAAYGPPAGVASLLIPADHSWSAAGAVGERMEPGRGAPPDMGRVEEAARLLKNSGAALLVSGAALHAAQSALACIHAATGARLFANRYAARITRGRGAAPLTRIPYFPEPAWALLSGIGTMVTVQAEPPVSFFGYPNSRSTLAPEGCRFFELCREDEDPLAALEALALALGEVSRDRPEAADGVPLPVDGPLTVNSLGQALAALLPEGSIISDEMVSSGEPVNHWLARAARHDLLPVTGGSIGQGLPVALGAAIACPERKVIALEADGSGMYSLQALWTMAREGCDVTVVVFANRRYRILEVEMQRTGAGRLGPRADAVMDLHAPELDWTALARGMGVGAERVERTTEFVSVFTECGRRRGPFLIEAVL